jgi:hypothetical protein
VRLVDLEGEDFDILKLLGYRFAVDCEHFMGEKQILERNNWNVQLYLE